ncbi:MAG: putative capsid protein [Cressdnaviricota sp.]|nr:MAG: putative capsid protein [Cressdnaviricota sp.]
MNKNFGRIFFLNQYYKMAYGNRRFHRRGRKPYKKRKTKSRAITKIVKRVLHSNIENKQAFKAVSGIRVNSAFPTTIGGGMYPIIPEVASAISGDNSKVGQQIKPLSLRLGMTAFINSASGNFNGPMYFDLYVFSIKKMKDATLYDTVGVGEVSRMFRPSLTGTDTAYDGRNYNWFQNVNQDVINLHHKKRFKMSPTNLAAISNLDGNWVDNYSQYSINYTLPLTKHIAKTLKYTNSIDTQPNNCALFATLCVTKADATSNAEAPVFVGGTVAFNSCMVYEDA